MNLFYDVYSVNPNAANFDSIADYVASRSVVARVTITALDPVSGSTPTPEPSGWALAAGGLVFVIVLRLKQLGGALLT
jgi:hypothetical protein